MAAWGVPEGTTVYRVIVSSNYETFEQKGEVCELKKQDQKRFVRLPYGNYIHELDATWFATEADALLDAAEKLEATGRILLERVQQLRTRAGEA